MSADDPTPDAPSEASSDAVPDAAREGASEPTRRRTRKVRRGPILFVVLVALVAAVVAQQNESSGSDRSGAAVAAIATAGVPASDVASSAWYCAAGTSTPDGAATETVVIASLSRTDIDATVTVMPGGDAAPTTHTVRLAPDEQVSVPVSDVLATAEPGVVVETVGGAAAVSHVLQHGGDVAVESCSRTAAGDWYFALGTTIDGAQQDLSLFNPFGDDAIVDVSFSTDTGGQEPAELQALVVPRHSRVTVPVQDSVLRQTLVAAHVHARAGRIVAEQTQIYDDLVVDGVSRTGIALSAGATSPATVWRVAAGSTEDGGRVQLALANFSSDDASVAVKTAIVGGGRLPAQTVRVSSQGVAVVDVSARVQVGSDLAVTATALTADGRKVPVVAEMLAVWPTASSSTGVASTVGATLTATRWVVPVPSVDAAATITVLNPGTEPVTATLLPADEVDRKVGPSSEPELAIGPGEAKVFRPAAQRRGGATAMVVTANHPVVVGLTLLGAAGAAITTALPDLSDATPTAGG